MLRSQQLLKKVGKCIRELDECSYFTGKKSQKLKSERGGSIDTAVKHKVHWPHEAILGGVVGQHITYNQLPLTQWVQGFCENIVEQKSSLSIYVNYCGTGDKFATSIILANQKRAKIDWEQIDAPIFHLWRDQVDFKFGYVPLQEQVMSDTGLLTSGFSGSLLQIHDIVKSTGKHNFLQARISIQSQLNVKSWVGPWNGYWEYATLGADQIWLSPGL